MECAQGYAYRGIASALTCLLLAAACQINDPQLDEDGPHQANNISQPIGPVYTVADVLLHPDSLPHENVWIAGFVVGYTQHSIANACFSATAAVQSNILLAPAPDDTKHFIPVELSTATLHSHVSLAYNPDSLHRAVMLMGNLATYYGVMGLRAVKQYQWLGSGEALIWHWPQDAEPDNDTPDTPNAPDTPDTPSTIIKAGTQGVNPCGIDINTSLRPDGTESAPYTPQSWFDKVQGDKPERSSIWFYGHAVGWVDTSGQWHLTATGAAHDNVLLSDVTTGCNNGNTIIIELLDEAMQEGMSLAAHPEHIGALVRFEGRLVSKGRYGKYCLQTSAEEYCADWLGL